MTIDLTEYTKEKVKVVPAAMEAVIIDLEVVAAKDVYGEKTKRPDQEMLKISCMNALYNITIYEHYVFYKPEEVTDGSQLGKFLTKYGKLDLGIEVTLIKNEKGFFEIALK